MTKSKILFLLNIILGSFIILYTIYIRLIVSRLPKELYIITDSIHEYVNLKLIIIISCGFVTAITQIIINIIIIYDIQKAPGIIKQIFIKINNIIDNALFEIFNLIIDHTPNAYKKMSNFVTKFYAAMKDYSEASLLLLLYFIRLLILTAFLLDVFMFFRLWLMYKFLYLLCFYLAIKILLYSLKDFASNLDTLEKRLLIIPEGMDTDTGLPITRYESKENNLTQNQLDYYAMQYIITNKLSGYLAAYDRYNNLLTPYFNILVYFLYFIGWSYIIYENIIWLWYS